jgi:hypothetical protein
LDPDHSIRVQLAQPMLQEAAQGLCRQRICLHNEQNHGACRKVYERYSQQLTSAI